MVADPQRCGHQGGPDMSRKGALTTEVFKIWKDQGGSERVLNGSALIASYSAA
jgi:hypothetical protein